MGVETRARTSERGRAGTGKVSCGRRVRCDVRLGTGESGRVGASAPLDPSTVTMCASPSLRVPPSLSTIARACLPMLPMGRATTELTPTRPRPTKLATWRTEAPCHTPRRTPPGPPPGLYQEVGPGLTHAHNEDENGDDSTVCTVVVTMTSARVTIVHDDGCTSA